MATRKRITTEAPTTHLIMDEQAALEQSLVAIAGAQASARLAVASREAKISAVREMITAIVIMRNGRPNAATKRSKRKRDPS